VASTSLSNKKKKEIRRLAEKACEDAEYNPFNELIEIATETEDIIIKDKTITVHKATRSERIAIAKEVAAYVQPKIKSTETEEKSAPTFVIQVQKFGDVTVSETANDGEVTENGTVKFAEMG
jgi:hypothetical protein